MELDHLRGPSFYTLNHGDIRTILCMPDTMDPIHRRDIKDEIFLAPFTRPEFLL